MAAGRRVLLITMPWATPVHPSLGIGLLCAILRRAGTDADCLYGNLLMPRPRTPTVCGMADPGKYGHYDDRSAGMSFVPYLYPGTSVEAIARAVAGRYQRIITRDGQVPEGPRLDWDDAGLREALIAQTREDIEHSGLCLSRCLDRIAAGDHDVIGFSLTFETQLLASLALARMVKERWPARRVVFGGAACASVQGVSVLRSFPWVDAVCLGEGDGIIVDLVRALRGESPLGGVPGLAYRDGDEVRTTPRLEPMHDLDWLPVPDYDSYLAQKAESEWAGDRSILMFETSRGCWWGEKHLCSFCGLNAEALVYRSKSPGRVLAELAEFRARWPLDDGLQAVDNIFDTRYFAELVPRLMEMQRERRVSIFFEIKSNLRLWQLFQLSIAGVTALQPGIESFSDHILRLMDKGATAFQQITFIKWAQQVGISPAYNILLRNPGETAEDYREMAALVPYLVHLQPPNGVANMELERFSPYFLRPEAYGIRNVRPKPHYRAMFPDERVDLAALVYQFDFDHDELDAPALVAARQELLAALSAWQARHRPYMLVYFVLGGEVLVLDRRGEREVRHHLGAEEAALFLYLDQARTFARIAARFPGTGEAALRAAIERLVEARLVCPDRRKDAYLAVPVRVYRNMDEYFAHYQSERARALQAQHERAAARRLPVIDQPGA